MGYIHGRGTRVFANGNALSSILDSAEVAMTNEPGETTVFDDKAKTFIVGLNDGTMGFSGKFDSADDGAALRGLVGADDNPIFSVFLGMEGAFTGQAIATALTTTVPVDGVAMESLDAQMAEHVAGQEGSILADGLPILDATAAATTGAGSAVDFGAHTGGVAVAIHVFGASAGGGTLHVRTSSATNFATSAVILTRTVKRASTYAEIVTSSVAAQRYLRASWSGVTVGTRLAAAAYKL